MTTKMILDETPATKDEATLTITMRGDVTKIVESLVHGFPKETLKQMLTAFQRELENRSGAGEGTSTDPAPR